MFYHLFQYLDRLYNIPGTGMFQYISFRAAAAVILALLVVVIFGRRIIDFLRRQQIGEEIRDLGLEGQLQKRGTPTMGGVIILVAILVPILLFGRLDNVYVQLMIGSTLWLGFIGGLDDYIKVFRHHKEGLKGRFKIVGQVGLGLIVGTTMWLSDDIVVRDKVVDPIETVYCNDEGEVIASHTRNVVVSSERIKTTQTTIPFIKNNEFDYRWLTGGRDTAAWLLYVAVAILVITAVSNGANLTDGLDGLATGVSVPIVAVLGALAYLSGHIVYADYLNIMYIPDAGELVVFAAAMAGALIGFLWYNSYPAQIFMGDTGSLSIGGIIAVFALCIRKELLLPLLCGVFLAESLSVMIQVSYFKYTKRRYGEGRRILLMSPLHHHYQKKGIFETKIATRFWIVSLLLAALTRVTLKIRSEEDRACRAANARFRAGCGIARRCGRFAAKGGGEPHDAAGPRPSFGRHRTRTTVRAPGRSSGRSGTTGRSPTRGGLSSASAGGCERIAGGTRADTGRGRRAPPLLPGATRGGSRRVRPEAEMIGIKRTEYEKYRRIGRRHQRLRLRDPRQEKGIRGLPLRQRPHRRPLQGAA